MKLSILIPMYNASSYIDRCLTSIINQGLKEEDYEVIIANDGSTDESSLIVSEYVKNHHNIQLLNQENIGADPTRNKLIKLAKGEFVYLMDADDYLAYNSLDTILSIGVENKLDFVGFDTIITNRSDLNDLNISKNDFEEPKVFNGQEFLIKYPDHRTEIWWFITRKEILDYHKISFGNCKGNGTGDVLFTSKILLNAKRVAYFKIPLHRYFEAEDSIMRSNLPEKNLLLMADFFILIRDFDRLVMNYENRQIKSEARVVDYLRAKRGTIVSHFIFQLLQKKIDFKNTRYYINELKQMDLYPINYSLLNIMKEKPSIKTRIFDFLASNEGIFYLLSYLYKVR